MGSSRQLAADMDCWSATANFISETGLSSKTGSMSDADLSDQRLSRIMRTIEGEIIPRLLLAHRIAPAHAPARKVTGRPTIQQDVQELARLVLNHDVTVARAFIDALRAEGASLGDLFLQLLAPTARLLGEYWTEDICDFTQVTVGLSRLQQLLREFSPEFEIEEGQNSSNGRRALLVPAPGEQHTFGLFIVEEFFRREGWEVLGGLSLQGAELTDLVRTEWFDVVGFSVSCNDCSALFLQISRMSVVNLAIQTSM